MYPTSSPNEGYPYPDGLGYIDFGWYDAVWVSGDTVIRGTDYGTSVTRFTAGEDATVLYETSGDRTVQPLVDRSSGTIYLRSPTLDESGTEYFKLGSVDSVGEPELVSVDPFNISNASVWFL